MKSRPSAAVADSDRDAIGMTSHQITESSDEPKSSIMPSRNLQRRLGTAVLFWILGLSLTAAGHWVYVSLRSLDRDISASAYQLAGARIAWLGHGDIEDAKRRAWSRHGSQLDMLSAEGSPEARIYTLPISQFWSATAAALVGGTFVLIWVGQFVKDNGIQSFLGVIAGHTLWLGGVEIGLDLASRRIGLAGGLEVYDNRLIGVHGTGILIQMSAVFLIPMLIGLTFHESNRCVVFRWLRKHLPLTRRNHVSGHVDNYSARTALQYFMTVWFCYVAILWLADPATHMVGHVLLFGVLVAIALFTPYMVWRAASQPSVAQALRYSVSGTVVTWTGIEIAAAMAFFEEPWLNERLGIGAVLGALCVALAVLSVRALLNAPSANLASST